MKRYRFLGEISKRSGVPRETCRQVVDGLTAVIVERMREGLPLRMVRFGTFEPMRLAARRSRDPRSGRTFAVPARTTVRFRPAKAVRDAVRG